MEGDSERCGNKGTRTGKNYWGMERASRGEETMDPRLAEPSENTDDDDDDDEEEEEEEEDEEEEEEEEN
jgi:hypothetical protein